MVKSVLGIEVKGLKEEDAHLIMQKMYFCDDGCDRTSDLVAELAGIDRQRACSALSAHKAFFRETEGGPAGPNVPVVFQGGI